MGCQNDQKNYFLNEKTHVKVESFYYTTPIHLCSNVTVHFVFTFRIKNTNRWEMRPSEKRVNVHLL